MKKAVKSSNNKYSDLKKTITSLDDTINGLEYEYEKITPVNSAINLLKEYVHLSQELASMNCDYCAKLIQLYSDYKKDLENIESQNYEVLLRIEMCRLVVEKITDYKILFGHYKSYLDNSYFLLKQSSRDKDTIENYMKFDKNELIDMMDNLDKDILFFGKEDKSWSLEFGFGEKKS